MTMGGSNPAPNFADGWGHRTPLMHGQCPKSLQKGEHMNSMAYLPNKDGHYVETKVPKYIIEILKRVKPKYDYTFILYPKYKYGQNIAFSKDIEQLEKWVKRYFADFKIIENHNEYRSKSERKQGRNIEYYLFEMTDPVYYQLQKAGILK